MKATPLFLATCVLILGGPPGHAKDKKKGLEIAKKVHAFNEGFRGETSTMEMLLINAHGEKARRKMTAIVREMKTDGNKSRIEFLWPPDVATTRMLTWTHRTGPDDQWLYLPSLQGIKRITARNKSGSFVGSEFAYEDIGSQDVEKFLHAFLSVEKVNGRATWKSERIPVDKRSGYSKQIIWHDKDYMSPVKIEYFDRKGTLLKTGIFSHWKRYGKWWRANKIEMRNHQTRKRSQIVWSERTLGVNHDDHEFDPDELAD